MKRLIVILSLLLCFCLSATAEENTVSVHQQILSQMADSVLQVIAYDSSPMSTPPFSMERKLGTGTGFVVHQAAHKTVILTAKHLLDMSEHVRGLAIFKVDFKGKTYQATYTTLAGSMDAGFLMFMPGIPGVKALELNLDYDDSVTEALCFGYGQAAHLKGQKQTYTYTHGYVSRRVNRERVFGKAYTLNQNSLYGTPTIIFGYSGGPVVDLDNKVIGISVAMMNQTNVFVDIRAVYNWMRLTLGRTDRVRVPYDDTFEIFNKPGLVRMAINDEEIDSFHSIQGKYTLSTLRDWMQAESKKKIKKGSNGWTFKRAMEKRTKNWVSYNTLININNKYYKIRSAELSGATTVGFYYSNPFAGRNNSRYIYMCGSGWEVIIGLIETTDAKEITEWQSMYAAEKVIRKAEAIAAAKAKEEADKKPI